jgi:very-short-patch-repair endonuclease
VSQLVDSLLVQIRALGLPEPEREVRFWPGRRFAFDLAWTDRKLAAEVEGGQFVRGSHQRPKRFESDAIKYNTAALMGWRVLRFPTSLVESGVAARTLAAALGEGER